jgi:hypothetical protein
VDDDAVTAFVTDHLAPPVRRLFRAVGVGEVDGLELADGRRVVVKVHWWNVTVERMAEVQRVQAHLADAGLPVPRPLVAAQTHGHGIVTVGSSRSRRTSRGNRSTGTPPGPDG